MGITDTTREPVESASSAGGEVVLEKAAVCV